MVFVVGGVILAAVGVWTVTHPDGGYRAAGGVGSGLSPGTRRIAGSVLIAVAILMTMVGIDVVI